MRHVIGRIASAAALAAFLETTANVIQSHSFYPVSVGMYAIIELLHFFVMVCVAALATAWIGSAALWTRGLAFFAIILGPLIFSQFGFYQGFTRYEQGGSVLVENHQLTNAGFSDLMLGISISVMIALFTTLAYFRPTLSSFARTGGISDE